MNKEYFNLIVKTVETDETHFTIDVKIDASCHSKMASKSISTMLTDLETECKDEFHESLEMFLSERGF